MFQNFACLNNKNIHFTLSLNVLLALLFLSLYNIFNYYRNIGNQFGDLFFSYKTLILLLEQEPVFFLIIFPYWFYFKYL